MANNIPDYMKNDEIDQSKLLGLLSGEKLIENIDETGNQIIDTSKNDVENLLIKITQTKTEFSKDKIDQYYDTEFSEFLENNQGENISNDLIIEDDIKTISDNQLQREAVLESQLDEMAKILEQETNKSTKVKEDAEETYVAMKNVIIDQRIKNGEGSEPSDFQDAFPFTRKEKSDAVDTSYDPKPFATDPS